MTGPDTRKRINELNKFIATKITPETFVLIKEVVEAQEEIKMLQSSCPHEYDDLGFCIYCDLRKD